VTLTLHSLAKRRVILAGRARSTDPLLKRGTHNSFIAFAQLFIALQKSCGTSIHEDWRAITFAQLFTAFHGKRP